MFFKDICLKGMAAFGCSWIVLGRSWAPFGRSWAHLGHFWPLLAALGPLLPALGRLLGVQICHFWHRFWASIFDRFLVRFEGHFGRLWGGFGGSKSVMFGIDFVMIFAYRSKCGSRAAKSAQGAAQERTRGAQERPKAAQEGPRAAKRGQKRPKAANERHKVEKTRF